MPTFFSTSSALRTWLKQHASNATELIVGFHKKSCGKASITWPEAVDEALCVGWIDGVRKRIDDTAYQIRFTPRKTTSTWSAINIARVADLINQGRMQPAGLKAFAHRSEAKSRTYSYEQALKWLRLFEQQSPILKWKRGRVEDAELSMAACVLVVISMNARRSG